MKMSANVPTNSATARRNQSLGTAPGYEAGRTDVAASLDNVTQPAEADSHEVTCPHCKKSFEAPLLEGSAERYNGFKCPHCRLFVPLERAKPQP